jgi:hypothetical protein
VDTVDHSHHNISSVVVPVLMSTLATSQHHYVSPVNVGLDPVANGKHTLLFVLIVASSRHSLRWHGRGQRIWGGEGCESDSGEGPQ